MGTSTKILDNILPPAAKLGQGYVFTRVCDPAPLHAGIHPRDQRQTPQGPEAGTPLPPGPEAGTPPPTAVHAGRYGEHGGGTMFFAIPALMSSLLVRYNPPGSRTLGMDFFQLATNILCLLKSISYLPP